MTAVLARRTGLVALAAAALWSTSAFAVPLRASSDTDTLHAMLKSGATGDVVEAVSPVNHRYSMLRATGTLVADDATLEPEARARNFLSIYGALVGVDSIDDLVLNRISRDVAGNTHVHLDQVHQGHPVYGARVVVHLSPDGVKGVSGIAVPGLAALPSEKRMPFSGLRAQLQALVTRVHPGEKLSLDSHQLMYYRQGMTQNIPGDTHLAYSARLLGRGINEQVLIDAVDGKQLGRFSLVGNALYRKIYTPKYDATNEDQFLVRGEGDPALSPVPIPLVGDPVDNLYDFAGGVYDFYKNMFGRDSYDDKGAKMHSVYLVNDQCPNAYWDGTSTNYCPDFDFDDVVSHEWTHAVSQFTHGLVYAYQSGALNESYSDIFGETIDLTNGRDGLGGTKNSAPYPDGVRWMIGEDFSLGAIDSVDQQTGYIITSLLNRDMWNPDRLASPGKVSSTNYYCDTSDGGGVHTNSGVPNHTYALLVDGGTYNGVTVNGLGIVKAMNIYYGAMTHYQTPTTTFSQHADALNAACLDLVGAKLHNPDGTPSNERIYKADCGAVRRAAQATELYKVPSCDYATIFKRPVPPNCPDGSSGTPVFRQIFSKLKTNAVPAGWTLTSTGTGDAWPNINWVVTDQVPGGKGRALFAVNSTGGTCASGGDISGKFSIDTPQITVKTGADKITFSHYVETEAGYDGGNFSISVNGGDFTLVPKANYTFNAPNGALSDAAIVPLPGVPDPVGLQGNNTNPKAGEAAWTGTDAGKTTGSWGKTQVDLAGIAAAGDKIKMRWEFGNDGCGGVTGWYVERVQQYYCAAQ